MSVDFRLATIAGLLALTLIGPEYAIDTIVAQLRSLTERPAPPGPIREARPAVRHHLLFATPAVMVSGWPNRRRTSSGAERTNPEDR